MIHACAIGPKISLLERKWDLQKLRVLPKCMQLEKDSDFWTGSMMVPNMAVITHYLIPTFRKIQLPSPLGSTSWLRLGLLSKLEEIFLPEDPFSLGACKHPSAIIRFWCLQPSHQCFHPLPGYNVKETSDTWTTPDSKLSLKNWREVGVKECLSSACYFRVSIQETFRSVDLIFFWPQATLGNWWKWQTLSQIHISTKLYLQFQGHERPSESHPWSTGNCRRFDHRLHPSLKQK